MRLIKLIPAVIFCFACSIKANAQYNFPLAELEKLTAKNASDFETVVMEKDYSLQAKTSTSVLKVYTSDKPSESGKQNMITRYQVPNAVSKIEFSTTDKKYYIEVKASLGKLGFKFLGQEDKTIKGTQATVNNYSNGPFQLSLATYATDNTWYQVTINSN